MDVLVLLEASLEVEDDDVPMITITCPNCNKERAARKDAKRIRKKTLCMVCARQRRKRKHKSVTGTVKQLTSRIRSKYYRRGWKPHVDITQVARICEKYNHKCILTGVDDLTKLTVMSFRPIAQDTTPDPNDLVLLSMEKALELESIADFSERRSHFDPEMQITILKTLNCSYTRAKAQPFCQLFARTMLDRKSPYRSRHQQYRHYLDHPLRF